MVCTPVKIGDTVAIVCTRRRRPRRCRCGAEATLLCDHATRGGKTCDQPICRRCATEAGPDRHLCPDHREAARQGALAL